MSTHNQTGRSNSMSNKNRNRNRSPEHSTELPKEVAEMVGDAEVTVEPKAGSGAGDNTGQGGTPQGRMAGDVNPIVADGVTLEQAYGDGRRTKSEAIRWLAAKDYQTKHIAKFLNIRYQHARNVLATPLKRNETTPATPQGKDSPALTGKPASTGADNEGGSGGETKAA